MLETIRSVTQRSWENEGCQFGPFSKHNTKGALLNHFLMTFFIQSNKSLIKLHELPIFPYHSHMLEAVSQWISGLSVSSLNLHRKEHEDMISLYAKNDLKTPESLKSISREWPHEQLWWERTVRKSVIVIRSLCDKRAASSNKLNPHKSQSRACPHLVRRSMSMDALRLPLLKGGGHMWPPLIVVWENSSQMDRWCVHTCTQSCPLVIRSLRTDWKSGLNGAKEPGGWELSLDSCSSADMSQRLNHKPPEMQNWNLSQ